MCQYKLGGWVGQCQRRWMGWVSINQVDGCVSINEVDGCVNVNEVDGMGQYK